MSDEQKPPSGGQPTEPPKPAEQAAPSNSSPDAPVKFTMDPSGPGSQNVQGQHVTLNNFFDVAAWFRGNGSLPGSTPVGPPQLVNAFASARSALEAAAQAQTAPPAGGLTNANATPGGAGQGMSQLPATDDEIDDWFLALDVRGRCAVRAMAVLSGAPAHEVARAREELYEALEAKRAPAASAGPAAAGPAPERPPSARELLAATFSEARVVNGATRLYWRSSADQSSAAFGQRMLALQAGEIGGTRGVPGEHVLARITAWAARGTGERRWRAARALGAIWWQLDPVQLEAQGKEWAMAASGGARESAAGLIFGAFEMESAQASQAAQTGERNPRLKTLEILTRWSDLAFAQAADQGLVQAVATADLFIGHEHPEAALDGLDYLLQLDPASEHRDDHSLTFGAFALALLAYVTLAWMGQTRGVVARLAAHAERLVRRPRPSSMQAALRQSDSNARKRRELNLFAITFIWFLLVASSGGAIDGASGSDGLTLPDKLVIPDEQGRDPLLLAVLLDHEMILRQRIVTLMAAAFCHTHGPLASEALFRWASVVARTAPPDSGARADFTRFLIAVGQETRRWDMTTGATGLDAGFSKYQNLLSRWPRGARASAQKSELDAERTAAEMAANALRQLAITADATVTTLAATFSGE